MSHKLPLLQNGQNYMD